MQGLDEEERCDWQYNQEGKLVLYRRKSVAQSKQQTMARQMMMGEEGDMEEGEADGAVDVQPAAKR